jgi:N-acetylglucosaminyl-diphospho-decaprenol L-rhamnosyltransferase
MAVAMNVNSTTNKTFGSPRRDERPDVTVILVSYNTADLLERTLSALKEGRGTLQLQVIVVDNASHDNSVELVRTKYPEVELIQNATNVGFALANNQALSLAHARYVLLLNSDAFVSPDTLPKTVEFMDAHPNCGVLGVKLVGEDGSLQPSCRYFPTPWNIFLASTGLQRYFPRAKLVDDMAWDHASVRDCDWVPGCFYLVRYEVIARVGLFDSRYFAYYEEVDHCRAVRKAGWSVTYYPYTQVCHIGGASAASTGLLDSGRQNPTRRIESELLYFRKHYGMMGMLVAALLAVSTNIVKACWNLVRRRNTNRAKNAMRDAKAIVSLMFATRLGARAIR